MLTMKQNCYVSVMLQNCYMSVNLLYRVRVMVFNTTLNNILGISWWAVLLVLIC